MKFSSVSMSILAASVLLASSTAFAAANYKGENYKETLPACPPIPTLMSGFYLGGQVGYDSYRVRENISNANITANPPINLTGFVGGLFLGYGQYFDNFYLAGEALVDYDGSSTSFSITDALGTYNSKIQATTTYGLSLLPGVKLNDTTLGYIRLGYNWTVLKSTESSTGLANASKSNTSGGFNYGLGVETLLTGNWSLRTEYTHTNYNSFSSSMGTSFNPANNQYMLGIVYHFA